MHKVYSCLRFNSCLIIFVFFFCALLSAANAGTLVSGHVFDLKGNPLHQAMVSIAAETKQSGADVVTVFTDEQGRFTFPQSNNLQLPVTVRVLGYEQLRGSASDSAAKKGNKSTELTIIMRSTPNYADVAPPSAWLEKMSAPEKEHLVAACIGCHQVPSPETRAYAKQIAAVTGADPASVRKQSWSAIVKYMNFISAEEFGRGRGASAAPPEPGRVYGIGDGEEVATLLSDHFTGPMEMLSGYDYGAPLAVTADTVIKEYEIPRPNAIREALMLGTPPKLWVADVSSNRIFSIDVATGKQKVLEVPTKDPMAPHSLHRGQDGSLWVAPFFPSIVARLDPDKETWQSWELKSIKGKPVGIHDLSFGHQHELLTDKQGRIWFSDIRNNGVGYLDLKTGAADNFHTPEIPGRPGKHAALYGLAMTSDQKHIWYSQLGIGSFGSFNIETLKFETSVKLASIHAGPRRLSISDDDILYVPLYGAGQLIEYDTKANKQIGIYDLPDRASAPYSVTWDPVRKVVWVPTSNADVIYRFDPKTKTFGVLPLPRTGAFLRMLDVDPKTGVLITSYSNIVENVHGPRMAVIIDPGDKVYQAKAKQDTKLALTQD